MTSGKLPARRLVLKVAMPIQQTILSLVGGGGGLDLGFENAGYKAELLTDFLEEGKRRIGS